MQSFLSMEEAESIQRNRTGRQCDGFLIYQHLLEAAGNRRRGILIIFSAPLSYAFPCGSRFPDICTDTSNSNTLSMAGAASK